MQQGKGTDGLIRRLGDGSVVCVVASCIAQVHIWTERRELRKHQGRLFYTTSVRDHICRRLTQTRWSSRR